MRLGILGGTFNPIHLGHLMLAECAREQCALDQIWFLPTATPPHKAPRDLLDGAKRLALIRLAIRGHPSFRASDLELELGGISYTIRTVRFLHARYPRARLFLIVGSDMLQVPWVGLSELSSLCTFAVAPRVEPHGQSPWHLSVRPGGGILSESTARGRGASRRVDCERLRRLPRMQRLVMPQMAISSSMIRARIRRGQSIRYLVPEAVARSIVRRRLYR